MAIRMIASLALRDRTTRKDKRMTRMNMLRVLSEKNKYFLFSDDHLFRRKGERSFQIFILKVHKLISLAPIKE
ncbi:hypothetical protein DP116_08710 [Brasilonema bromeliae SPC951]|uniref:Uncharacterized protein n=1 Tax=Brasilonema bromeliae SPC951 TaxID=385972 RepID=A0ABX1P672_9CYAN|nr:hypothetical protein [Brasilonema bromeliae SPC951]